MITIDIAKSIINSHDNENVLEVTIENLINQVNNNSIKLAIADYGLQRIQILRDLEAYQETKEELSC